MKITENYNPRHYVVVEGNTEQSFSYFPVCLVILFVGSTKDK